MDMQWLANEAKHLHQVFMSSFYILVTILLLIGIILEYFKIPLGQIGSPMVLVGRTLIAALLLSFTPEIMNTLGAVTDGICQELGSLNEIKFMLSRLGDKMGDLTWSWISVKDSVLLLISFGTFFLLYITVYIMNAYFLFTWMLLYVFSPVLCALYVIPQTAGATIKLYRSLLEVCLWKITWGVLASLLWSMALSDINQQKYEVDFLTSIILNLMLAFSILITPKIVGSFLGSGISSVASGLGNVLMGAMALTPTGALTKSKLVLGKGARSIHSLRNNQETESSDVISSKKSILKSFNRK